MKIPVLDHGYVEFIESWGHGKAGLDIYAVREGGEPVVTIDEDLEVGIIEAARQSTQGSFRRWEEDEKLLRHLFTNNHLTPFEFAGMVIEIQAPIFVFREWHRHRTQSYNEMSARYAPLPDLNYIPERNEVLRRGAPTVNKQAAGVAQFDPFYIDTWLANVQELCEKAEHVYQAALAHGIPKELARITMPVAHYSRMRAAGNLRNWLAFMTLRCDPKAQWEIQQFAWAVANIVAEKFPQTFKLWDEQHNQ